MVGVAQRDQLVRFRLRVVIRNAASFASVPLLVKKTLFNRGGVIARSRSASSIWERIRKSVLGG